VILRVVLIGILMALIARAFWRVIDGLVEGLTGRNSAPRAQVGMQMVRDPVCGTFVLPDRAVSLAEGSRHVFFCSTRCRDKYRARTA
jgi:uncharacterized protein